MSELTKEDIKRYAIENTDFGFEMKVLRSLKACGWEVEHSGTYVDPISKKNREFDLRASKRHNRFPFSVLLSVECKNLSSSFPLVVQSVQRTKREAFHDIIYYQKNDLVPKVARSTDRTRYSFNQDDWVAKSFDQIRLDSSKKGFVSGEGKTFDKMSQALNSAEGLLHQCWPLEHDGNEYTRYVVVPVLVVPDGCLWRVRYGENGEPIGEPDQVESAQYFVNQNWGFSIYGVLSDYTISHLEVVTISAIKGFVDGLVSDNDGAVFSTFYF